MSNNDEFLNKCKEYQISNCSLFGVTFAWLNNIASLMDDNRIYFKNRLNMTDEEINKYIELSRRIVNVVKDDKLIR